jgi:hypothetical protein
MYCLLEIDTSGGSDPSDIPSWLDHSAKTQLVRYCALESYAVCIKNVSQIGVGMRSCQPDTGKSCRPLNFPIIPMNSVLMCSSKVFIAAQRTQLIRRIRPQWHFPARQQEWQGWQYQSSRARASRSALLA